MRLKVLALALLVAPFSWAGGCFSDLAVSQSGVGFRAVITVFNTVPAITLIYQDSGLVQGKDNPFESNSNGRFLFCAPRGFYTVQVSGPGVTLYSYSIWIGDGTSTSTVTLRLCSGTPCTTMSVSDVSITTTTGTINKCWISAGTLPTTTNLIADVKYDGGSIYQTGNTNKLNLTPTGGVPEKDPLAPVPIVAGKLITASIVQIGSGTAGQDVVIACQVSLN